MKDVSLADTNLEAPIEINVFTKVAIITFYQRGVRKQIMTHRAGLRYLQTLLSDSLDNPLSNRNGKTFTNVLH
jgi:hypothetical protein